MKDDKVTLIGAILALSLALLYILFWVGLLAGGLYCILHFISKFW